MSFSNATDALGPASVDSTYMYTANFFTGPQTVPLFLNLLPLLESHLIRMAIIVCFYNFSLIHTCIRNLASPTRPDQNLIVNQIKTWGKFCHLFSNHSICIYSRDLINVTAHTLNLSQPRIATFLKTTTKNLIYIVHLMKLGDCCACFVVKNSEKEEVNVPTNLCCPAGVQDLWHQ